MYFIEFHKLEDLGNYIFDVSHLYGKVDSESRLKLAEKKIIKGEKKLFKLYLKLRMKIQFNFITLLNGQITQLLQWDYVVVIQRVNLKIQRNKRDRFLEMKKSR